MNGFESTARLFLSLGYRGTRGVRADRGHAGHERSGDHAFSHPLNARGDKFGSVSTEGFTPFCCAKFVLKVAQLDMNHCNQ